MPAFVGTPSLDVVLAALRTRLQGYLPAPLVGLPPHHVELTQVRERPVGLGQWRGMAKVGPFELMAEKGKRLDGMIRFRLWHSDPHALEMLAQALKDGIAADKSVLRTDGLLVLDLAISGPATLINTPSMWSKSIEYKSLYEFSFVDGDAAESLIHRIPIQADPEVAHSLARETTLVSGRLMRWDQEQAHPLMLSGPATIPGLAVLEFLPSGLPSGAVSVIRTHLEASGPPNVYPSFAAFLTAITHASTPDRHASFEFVDYTSFQAEFTPVGGPFPLGDWNLDSLADSYQAAAFAFINPVSLPHVGDEFRVIYAAPALDTTAVVYLRTTVS